MNAGTPRDVHRSGVIVCPACARFGREDCKEHRATAVSVLEAAVDGCARHGRTDCDDCFMEATLGQDQYRDQLEHERNAARHEIDRLLAEERRLLETLTLVGAALSDIDDDVTEACGLGSDSARTIAYQLLRIREALR